MKGVPYDRLRWVLNISYDKWSEIRDQYQSDEQRREAMIAHTLSTHPCMSWKQIARRLQQYGYSEAAAEVTRKYVKGQLRTTRHNYMRVHAQCLVIFECCMLYIICTPTNACIHVHTRIYIIFVYTTASQSVAIVLHGLNYIAQVSLTMTCAHNNTTSTFYGSPEESSITDFRITSLILLFHSKSNYHSILPFCTLPLCNSIL